MTFTWETKYDIGCSDIDEQHRGYFLIVNDIYSLVENDREPPKDKVYGMLISLANYAHSHFSAEEIYFVKFDYEEAKRHIALHDVYREQIKEFIRQYFDATGSDGELLENILQYATHWFSEHILEEDKKYKHCFEHHGVK